MDEKGFLILFSWARRELWAGVWAETESRERRHSKSTSWVLSECHVRTIHPGIYKYLWAQFSVEHRQIHFEDRKVEKEKSNFSLYSYVTASSSSNYTYLIHNATFMYDSPMAEHPAERVSCPLNVTLSEYHSTDEPQSPCYRVDGISTDAGKSWKQPKKEAWSWLAVGGFDFPNSPASKFRTPRPSLGSRYLPRIRKPAYSCAWQWDRNTTKCHIYALHPTLATEPSCDRYLANNFTLAPEICLSGFDRNPPFQLLEMPKCVDRAGEESPVVLLTYKGNKMILR